MASRSSGKAAGHQRFAAYALAAGLLAAPWWTTSHAQERCEPMAARIVSAQGTVELKRSGTDVWAAALLEQHLCIGDTVRVGAASRAALALANDSTLRLDERTTLRLRGVAEERRSLLDLALGAVYFFSHQPRALQVDTPFVNAAAEGTEFLVRVAGDHAEVVMLGGRVRLQNPQGELLVASGDGAVVRADQAPEPMIATRPRDAVAWALYYPPVLAPLAERQIRPRPLPPGLQAAVDLVAANDYPGALAALDAVPEAARDARYHTYRAGVLLNVGRVDQAEAALDQALALDPEAGDALAQRAVIRVVQNRREDALADAERAVELSPESGAAAVALSYAQQANFQLEDARLTLRQASERVPENALVFARLSEIEQSLGELGAAKDAAEQAVALAPQLARTQMVLGFAALTRIDIDQAKAAFERAIELDSALPLARLGLGLAIIRTGDLDAGAREIEIAAGLDPNDSLIRSYLGKAYFEERRDTMAGEQYQIAKELDPNDPTPWFYDAIRLQLDNRPVEALHDLERSIALNDNRAVFRSRLLLDEDLAVRETSLARIYDDLGFEQLALLEATKSLSDDPANYSAHRFLSDTYARLPRHEIARASELLQAQLMQPININPVQPSLVVTDLSLVAGAGPADAGFDEFGPLFTRNDAQVTATGVVGNNDTLGGETAVAMVHDRMSLSVGGLLSDTDGFRRNNDVNNQLANLYGQVAVTPTLNLQAEYRYRDTDQGDLRLNFDPESFSATDRRDVEQETMRIGGRWSPVPEADLIVSAIQSDRKGDQHVVTAGPRIDEDLNEDGYQIEGQLLLRHDWLQLTAGGGAYDIDVDSKFTFDFSPAPCLIPTGCEVKSNFNRKQENVYLYSGIEFPQKVTWTAGLSYDSYDQRDLDRNEFNPKAGVQWDVTDQISLRGAWFQTVKRDLIVGQTIEPTEIAGFNQFFDDLNGASTTRYGVGLDVRPLDLLYGGVEASRREIDSPTFEGESVKRANWDEELYRAYLYFVPLAQWAITAEVAWDRFQTDDKEPNVNVPKAVDTLSIPLAVRYFNPNGFFAEIGATFVQQDVDRRAQSTLSEGDDSFTVVGAAIGYRLPKRRGIISIEVVNLFDSGFKFQDDNYRSNEPRGSLYVPERTVLATVTLSF